MRKGVSKVSGTPYRVGELVRAIRAFRATDYLYQGLHNSFNISKSLRRNLGKKCHNVPQDHFCVRLDFYLKLGVGLGGIAGGYGEKCQYLRAPHLGLGYVQFQGV